MVGADPSLTRAAVEYRLAWAVGIAGVLGVVAASWLGNPSSAAVRTAALVAVLGFSYAVSATVLAWRVDA